MKVFVIDQARCNGCHNCQFACKDEHCSNEWPPYAVSQPDVGHFWLNVDTYEHGQVPKVRMEYRPVLCNHCAHAPCMEKAPECFYRRDDGLVILDPEKARGRKDLVDACPFGRIFWNDEREVAQKCTGCAHLVDAGEVPHCVDMCTTDALLFGDEEDFAEQIANAEFYVDSSVGPRVYYVNMPKLFVGGEVWDPQIDEIIEGAVITLQNSQGQTLETTSDAFGDFWFNRIGADSYTLTIKAEGYKSIEKDISVDKSLNLGDFPLERS